MLNFPYYCIFKIYESRVAIFLKKLWVDAPIRHIVSEFACFRSYHLRDIGVHTDRNGYINAAVDADQEYIDFVGSDLSFEW